MGISRSVEPALFDAVAVHVRDQTHGERPDAAQSRAHTIAICDWLEESFPDDPAARRKRALELTLAYGLGARRVFEAGAREPLDGVWPGAVQWLRTEIELAVKRGLELPQALIPGFEDIAPSVYEAVIDLFNWLVFPSIEMELEMGDRIDISSYPDCLEFRGPHGRQMPLYPGQRRTYLLHSGSACAGAPRPPAPVLWLPRCHLITRAGDFAAGRVHFLAAGGGATDLPFGAFEFASIHADEFCRFEDLSCKCGRDTCTKKHRISAFHPPEIHHKMTLHSFVQSAIRGPLPKPTPHSFKKGMLYAWLANRPVQDRIREAPLLRERMAKDDADHFGPFCDAADGLIRTSDAEPQRRLRCKGCGSLEPFGAQVCGFCGKKEFLPNPVTVWAYQGPRECNMEELEAITADDGLDIESNLIAQEEWYPEWEAAAANEST
jgi:hypothetical protein